MIHIQRQSFTVEEKRGNKNVLYIKSAALQSTTTGSVELSVSRATRKGLRVLSAAGQRPQRGVAVQAAVRLRRDGGVAARVGGLRGHGRDVVGRGGGRGGGGGLRGAVDHCGTCAARNTHQTSTKPC